MSVTAFFAGEKDWKLVAAEIAKNPILDVVHKQSDTPLALAAWATNTALKGYRESKKDVTIILTIKNKKIHVKYDTQDSDVIQEILGQFGIVRDMNSFIGKSFSELDKMKPAPR